MHLILAPFGSTGDINPFLGVGAYARDRGHRVTVVANEHFAGLAAREGLDFVACAPEADYERFIDDPRMWDSRSSVFLLYDAILQAMPETHACISKLHEPGRSVLAAPSFNIGARIAHETLGVPYANLVLNPILMRSIYSPGRSPLLKVPRWLGPIGPRLAYKLISRKYEQMLGAPVNGFRSSLGLPAVRGMMHWMRSPQRILCLWPDWVYERQRDWPPHARTTSFVHYDGASTVDGRRQTTDPEIGEQPPIVFTAGTALSQGTSFFAAAAEACARTGRPGLLLTQRPELLPDTLPAGVSHIAFAPFGELLPRSAALVHFGGIGTAARAIAAGIPQLIIPHVNDQYDNSARLVRVGVARELPREEVDGEKLARAIDGLLADAQLSATVKRYAERMDGEAGLQSICAALEGLAEAKP